MKVRRLAWDSFNVISNLFWLCSREGSASLHKPSSIWQKRCPNPTRHKRGVWMGFLALCSEPRYRLTRVQCLVLVLWSPLSQSLAHSTAQSTPPRISHRSVLLDVSTYAEGEHGLRPDKLVDLHVVKLRQSPLLSYVLWIAGPQEGVW